jgi:hypothetical protein
MSVPHERELVGQRHLAHAGHRRQAFSHPGGEPHVVFADPDDYATLRGAASIVLSRSLDVAF